MQTDKATRIAGTVATVLSLSMVLIGLPSQMYENWQKHQAGMSIFLAITAFVLYSAWSIYAILKKDRYLIIAQGTGAIVAFALLVQTIYYMVTNR